MNKPTYFVYTTMDDNYLVEIGIVESDGDLTGKELIGKPLPIAEALAAKKSLAQVYRSFVEDNR